MIGLKLDRYASGGASHPTCPPKHWRRRKLRNLGSIVAVGSEGWWTRSQTIRTEGEMLFEGARVDLQEPRPTNRIAGHLGVDRTTVTRALRWLMSESAY